MAQGTAPKRSIDEIIGSIRSIVDRTEPGPRPVANDDIRADIESGWRDTSDLVDVPDLPRAAANPMVEPVAAPVPDPIVPDVIGTEDDDELDPFVDPLGHHAGAVDAAQMAEIAAAVERNLVEVAEATREVSGYSDPTDAQPTDAQPAVADTVEPARAVANDAPVFGRRGVPEDERTPLRAPAANVHADTTPETLDDALAADLEAFLSGEDPGGSDEAEGAVSRVEPSAPDARFAALREKVAAPPPVVAPAVDDAMARVVEASPSAIAPGHALQTLAPALAAGAAMPTMADPQLSDELLRPIIREWLDDNLPPLVERLVREELERAVSGRRPN